MTIDPAGIGEHYDERSPIEDEIRDGQLHMWYWYDREDPAPLTEALHRITRKVTATLGLRADEHLLDAGCGPGETAIYVAKEFGAKVTGISVSGFEIDKANERAAAAGAEGVDFEYGDFAELSYPDNTFDAVLALESLQNAVDLGQVLDEFFRVLRPGGRITFSDFSRGRDGDPARLAKFMTTLKLAELPSLEQWVRLTEAAGFVVEEFTQCGPRVYGMKAKYLEEAMHRREGIAAKFGDSAVTDFSRKNIGFYAPRKDQVGYVIISARKPY
ncbi:gamma-tocopherol methyltransferase @ delta-tocopherol methyltransferase [Alloactinosynnema sp. L-07]|uniref:class I SAM-dependent methyltransferase n=1 Tax=Alloactinosynnema sp. L-07 TaxID=1653480 RepID=UPI00065EF8D3|nr:methyltransferase domain-containing protein [Alloactinosynnema sp. L-07]CRK59454.1 gamma-tocopherol methyltransferase @ delta-tocopherol methyltransferase [Alloactinosynnema sp. L-07]